MMLKSSQKIVYQLTFYSLTLSSVFFFFRLSRRYMFLSSNFYLYSCLIIIIASFRSKASSYISFRTSTLTCLMFKIPYKYLNGFFSFALFSSSYFFSITDFTDFFDFLFPNFTSIIDWSFYFFIGDGISTELVFVNLDESDLWIGFKVICDFLTLGGTNPKIRWFCFLLATLRSCVTS